MIKPGSNFTLLLRKEMAPHLVFTLDDMSSLAEIDLSNYYIPFNTTVPMIEFDTMTQLVDHYDTVLEQRNKDQESSKAKARQVSDQDIILMSYNQPQPLWKIMVLIEGGKKSKEIRDMIKEHPTIEYANTIYNGRFILAATRVTGLEYVAELIDRHKSTNN